MRRLIWIPLSIILFTACGEETFIARRIKFRAFFIEQAVQIKFELDPKYILTASNTFEFDKLGVVFYKWTGQTATSEIGSTLFANPHNLNAGWPAKDFRRFPNGDSLPPSVPLGYLKNWQLVSEAIQPSLLYQAEPNVIAGGALTGVQFNLLPKKFLATQKFYTANHEVQATISVAGPTDRSQGGIYFLGNFGVNPFTVPPTQSKLLKIASDREWELTATEPLQIIRYGEIRASQFFSGCHELGCFFAGDTPSPLMEFAP
jgi:hypothetical protein